MKNIARIIFFLFFLFFLSMSFIICSSVAQSAESYGVVMDSVFNNPCGIAFDRQGNIIVADSSNNVVRKVTPLRKMSTLAGEETFMPGYKDGELKDSLYYEPSYVAVGSSGTIYISDTGNNVVRKITKEKSYTLSGNGIAGYTDGTREKSSFNMPSGIAADKEENIYVSDTLNHVIRKIDTKGNSSLYAGVPGQRGYKNGSSNEALFNEPAGLAFGPDGVLYVADSANHMIRAVKDGNVYDIAGVCENIDPLTQYAEGAFKNGDCIQARFNFPKGITVGSDGTIYIADTWNNMIRAVKNLKEVITVAGTGESGNISINREFYQLNLPVGIAIYRDTLYISDSWNNRICSFKINERFLEGIPDKKELIKDIENEMANMAKEDEIQVWFNENKIDLNFNPYLNKSRLYLPLIDIFNAWGAECIYNNETGRVLIQKENFILDFVAGVDFGVLWQDAVMIESNNLQRVSPFRVEWFPEYNAVFLTVRR